LSFLEGEKYDYFFFVTYKSELLSEEEIELNEERGNSENYIKEAKYDTAVGHLLLQTFCVNEAVFQVMTAAYNLFLFFKVDFAKESESRQQIRRWS
jgi:hypothetical protein